MRVGEEFLAEFRANRLNRKTGEDCNRNCADPIGEVFLNAVQRSGFDWLVANPHHFAVFVCNLLTDGNGLEESGFEEKSYEREDHCDNRNKTEKREHLFNPPCLVAFCNIFVSRGSAECVVEEVHYGVCAFNGFVVLGVYACDFINRTESSVNGFAALRRDKHAALGSLFVDAFVYDCIVGAKSQKLLAVAVLR